MRSVVGVARNIRIWGVNIAENHARTLAIALLADERDDALKMAELLSDALTRHADGVGPLTPGMRDALLDTMPRPLPSGLVALRDALAQDKLARK
jgi:hypothetical protein